MGVPLPGLDPPVMCAHEILTKCFKKNKTGLPMHTEKGLRTAEHKSTGSDAKRSKVKRDAQDNLQKD